MKNKNIIIKIEKLWDRVVILQAGKITKIDEIKRLYQNLNQYMNQFLVKGEQYEYHKS